MIEPQRIAQVMGGRRVFGHRVVSILDLSEAIAKGLPKTALRNTVQRVFRDARDQRQVIYRVVPEATFKRRRDRLSFAESERTERLARVIASAEYVWGDREEARQFLTTPHPALAGKTPVAAAMTELGARQTEELLNKILHGLPA